MYNLKIVIVGAGIGGLTSGIACRRAGYDVEIYERVRELWPAGGGITLWPNGIKVLNMLGLGEKLAAIAGRMNRMENRSHTDEQLSCINLKLLEEKVGQRPYPIARRNLQGMLLDAFGSEKVHLGMKCVAVEQDERSATAIFEDGTRATGDVLIGADGIRSTIREYVLGREVQLRYADYVNWNGLVAASDDLCDSDRWVIYVGEEKRASIMSVGGDRFSFVLGAPMPKGTTVKPEKRRAELREIFAGWPQSVQRLIQRLEPLKVNRVEIHDMDPLERLVGGRIALLGDAGHASTPALGQGACQAMEDVEVLLRYLITTNISVEDALRRYEAERKGRTATLVLRARQRTDTIYGKDPEVTQHWYKHLKEQDESEVINTMAKIILGGSFQ
ncbi:MAG: FAD-dependent urate hydroxylase HpxO [Xenococcaceae cyanobacterium]